MTLNLDFNTKDFPTILIFLGEISLILGLGLVTSGRVDQGKCNFLSRISFTFIPNLDLFAPNQLLGLQAIIRLLQLRNKSFQTIITAYPLQNVEEVKKAFFNSAYETYDCTWNHENYLYYKVKLG